MSHYLTFDEFVELSKNAKRVSVHHEISIDDLTPIGIIKSLDTEMQDGVILESGMRHEDSGQRSFIAFDLIAELRAQHNQVTTRIGTESATHIDHPFHVLRQLMSQLSCVSQLPHVDYMNGAIGFVTYDAIRLFESIPDRHISDNQLPEMIFNFYRTTLMYHHLQQKLVINTIVDVDPDLHEIYQKTQNKITSIIKKITTAAHSNKSTHTSILNPSYTYVDVEDEEFIQLVEKAKQHIINGDTFQIVLSRCFKKAYTVSPFEIYRALRKVSPAPYMFYLPIDDYIIIGASPEKLVKVNNRHIEINPIAGTRQRTATTNDEQITDELLNDVKERAEHMMLVDLARNDAGVVCEPGSVKVSDLLQVKHYSHVSHITSVITGYLRDDKDALDAFIAAFPAGTVSGAPKIRAMQIIDNLETSKRGIYGGAICRIDFKGNLDSCLAIRMATLKDGIATVRTGAGIVYDSNPQSEANETRQKAKGILDAITYAEEVLV